MRWSCALVFLFFVAVAPFSAIRTSRGYVEKSQDDEASLLRAAREGATNVVEPIREGHGTQIKVRVTLGRSGTSEVRDITFLTDKISGETRLTWKEPRGADREGTSPAYQVVSSFGSTRRAQLFAEFTNRLRKGKEFRRSHRLVINLGAWGLSFHRASEDLLRDTVFDYESTVAPLVDYESYPSKQSLMHSKHSKKKTQDEAPLMSEELERAIKEGKSFAATKPADLYARRTDIEVKVQLGRIGTSEDRVVTFYTDKDSEETRLTWTEPKGADRTGRDPEFQSESSFGSRKRAEILDELTGRLQKGSDFRRQNSFVINLHDIWILKFQLDSEHLLREMLRDTVRESRQVH